MLQKKTTKMRTYAHTIKNILNKPCLNYRFSNEITSQKPEFTSQLILKLYFPRPTLRTPALLLEAVLTFGAFFAPVLSTFFTVLFPKNLLDICSVFNNVNTAVW